MLEWLTASRRILRKHRRGRDWNGCVSAVESLEPRVLLSALGTETLVDATAGSERTFSPGSVAAAANGDFVVVYMGTTAFSPGIYAQRFRADGVAQGGLITVIEPNQVAAQPPQVAMAADGDFVIVYSLADQEGNSVYAARYDSNGQALGTVKVNDEGAGPRTDGQASVAMDDQGNFVVSWSRLTPVSSSVLARQFTAAGVALDQPHLVHSVSPNLLIYSTVAMDADGDFIVCTSTSGDSGNPGQPLLTTVSIQRYDSAGVAAGNLSQIAAFTTDDRRIASVAVDDDGDFVVSWVGYNASSDLAVIARQFDTTGTAVGAAFQVNTTPGIRFLGNSSVAMDADGDFAITWSAEDTPGDPAAWGNVFGRQYKASGAAASDVFLVNTTTQGHQWQPSVAMAASGNFVIAWTSNVVTYQDNLNDTVFFQRYSANTPPMLTDIEPYPLVFPSGSPATAITATLTITDPDDTQLQSATVQIVEGLSIGDVLGFVNTGTLTGSYNPGTGTLTITGTDTLANYQAALRSVTFSTMNPSSAARTIQFQVRDAADPSNSVHRVVGALASLSGSTLTVFGTGDNDVITVSHGAMVTVVVNGSTVEFNSGLVSSVLVHGFDGNDSIQIASLPAGVSVQIQGGNGNDSLVVHGSVTGPAILSGGSGNDLLIGGSGDDSLDGGDGNDWLDGGEGSDTSTGGSGDDVFAFQDAVANQIDQVIEQAGGGIDQLNFSAVTSAVTADLGNSTLAGMSRRIVQVGPGGAAAHLENLVGGSAGDMLIGNAANNTIVGGGGNDTLRGGDGSDALWGGLGNDLLRGGDQADVLFGEAGDDYLIGEAGADVLNGGEGTDAKNGGAGDDTYVFGDAIVNQIDTLFEQAGEGVDLLDFRSATTAVTIQLASDTLLAAMNHRIVNTGAGQAVHFENAAGGAGNDQIRGNSAANMLWGHGGNDTLHGDTGHDLLLGGSGDDALLGESGRNILIGGTGGDLLIGGSDGDVLIAGTTDYDSAPGVLTALLAEWASSNSYSVRVGHLQSVPGGANAFWYLNSVTVQTSDGVRDYLTGNQGQDWFLVGAQDLVTDSQSGEITS